MQNQGSKTGRFLIIATICQLYLLNYLIFPWLLNEFGATKLASQWWDITRYSSIVIEYLVIAICMWLERNNLGDFHFDRMSLITIVISSFFVFRNKLGIPGEEYYLLIIGFSGLLIATILWQNWFQIPITSWRWVAISIVMTSLILIPTTVIDYIINNSTAGLKFDIVGSILFTVRDNLSFTVTIEEPIFRGFLWGYLCKLGWEENKVIAVQAVLFWFLHLRSFSFLLIFLLSLPLIILTYNYLVQRSKQIFPSIISHLLYNTMVSLIWRLFVH
jgi:membrane protease YdiL (CAAX protease family)